MLAERDLRFLSLIIAAAICFLPACSAAQQRPGSQAAVNPSQTTEKKVLIAYLSRTNNTKAVAEFIHENVGGTMVALETAKPYPENYQTTVEQVARENETDYLPPLKTKIERIEQYDVVFLGFPTWGMQLPPPIKSFLSQYSFKGKTVIPFNTNAGYGVGSSFQTVKELCSGCTLLEGFVMRGGIERDGKLLVIKDEKATEARVEVMKWLQRIKMIPDQR